MSKKDYKISKEYSNKQLGQTDFGEIYYNTPHHIDEPSTTEELASLLKSYNDSGTSVVVRNTGHSMNGQTLTDGVQVSLVKMQWVEFNEDKLEVRVGAGVSWDTMLKIMSFPKYCPPVFPNNPGQEIHVAGQVAVGGIGFYSSKYGGLWNWVKEITLVTMQGEIIKCSREVEPDLFAYSLGGHGRIGVMSEVVIEVKKSSNHVIPIELMYLSHDHYVEDAARMIMDDKFDGIVYAHESVTPRSRENPHMPAHVIFVFVERPDSVDSTDELIEYIQDKYHGGLIHSERWPSSENRESKYGSEVLKKDVVYYYPHSVDYGQYLQCHPWNDYVVTPDVFPAFYKEVEKVLGSSLLEEYAIKAAFKESRFKMNLDVGGYGLKNLGLEQGFSYPLCLDLENEPYAIHIGSSLTVPVSMLQDATNAIDELTHRMYEVGGRRYLYGYHSLTVSEVEKHYGRSVIDKWQQLKNENDPKHLLNIGVIEHLDEM